MKLRSFFRAVPGALVCVSFILSATLRSAESDLGALRAKAESGNAIAQYNLGLAYFEGQQIQKDVIEAYVWLTLAAENGATGKALKTLTPVLSAAQLSAADVRLADRRSVISTHLLAQSAIGAPGSAPAPRAVRTAEVVAPPMVSPPTPAPAAVAGEDRAAALAKELATLRADNAKLSAEVAAVWKELDAAKGAQAKAAQRADQFEAAVGLRAKEVNTLTTERDHLQQQLATALAAAKPAAPAPRDDSQAKALAAAEDARTKAVQRADQAEAAAGQRTKDISALTTERDHLKQQLATALAAAKPAPRDDSQAKALAAAEDARTKAAQRADQAEAAAGQRAKEVSALTTERDHLKQQLATALTAAKPAPRDDTQAKALAAAEKARVKIAADLETVRQDLAAAQKVNKELGAQVDRLAGEDASLKVEMAARLDASKRLEETQAALVRLQAENADYKARLAAPTEVSSEDPARLKQDLARARQTVEMTVRSYALVRQENEQLKARLDKVQPAVGAVPDTANKPASAAAAKP